ncbi:MAG: hypothetical protein U1E14_01725 [Geminicoccaceae bacterium]
MSADGPVEVTDCQPCVMALAQDSNGWLFFFDYNVLPDRLQVIRQIRVRAPRSSRDMVLPVESMLPAEPGGGYRFGGEDLDGDGWRDLVLVTADGGANAYADYWRYDPADGSFVALGTLPLLGRDPDSGHLVGLEHGSADGLFFTRTDYGFENGELVVLAVEAMLPADDPAKVHRVVQERRQGQLVTTIDVLVPLQG